MLVKAVTNQAFIYEPLYVFIYFYCSSSVSKSFFTWYFIVKSCSGTAFFINSFLEVIPKGLAI